MIELTPQQQQFVDSHIAAGIFAEPAEVVGVALALLQQRQSEYSQLETAIREVEGGEYKPLDMEDVKRRGNERKIAERFALLLKNPEIGELQSLLADGVYRRSTCRN